MLFAKSKNIVPILSYSVLKYGKNIKRANFNRDFPRMVIFKLLNISSTFFELVPLFRRFQPSRFLIVSSEVEILAVEFCFTFRHKCSDIVVGRLSIFPLLRP